MEIDHRYTWTLPQNAWYIKFYLWLWEANPKEVTFCKLFWGYTLAWLAVPMKIGLGFMRLVDKVTKATRTNRAIRRNAQRALRDEQVRKEYRAFLNGEGPDPLLKGRKPPKPPKPPKPVKPPREGPSFMQRRLTNIENGGTRVSMQAKRPAVRLTAKVATAPVVYPGRWLTRFLRKQLSRPVVQKGIGITIMAMGLLSLIAYIIMLGIVAILVAVGTALLMLGLGYLISQGFLMALAYALRDCVGKPVAHGSKKGALTFKEVMKIGYVSVKSNTCPRVVIDDSAEEVPAAIEPEWSRS